MLHILLVEDDDVDVEAVVRAFQKQQLDYSFTIVANGVEALLCLRGDGDRPPLPQPYIILLDLNLPRMNGKQFLAEMRADKAFKNIPVVILTTSDAESDIVQGYSLGANCYVTKPVDLKAFQTIVLAVENFWFTVVKLPPPGVS